MAMKKPLVKPTFDPQQAQARMRGALLGLAVGDALGATLEFKRLMAPPFPKLADGVHTEITGGGPHGVRPGQVTDDTQMAACLATSLRELKAFDAADVTRKYVRWLPHAFDVGIQTRAVLSELAQGGPLVAAASRKYWQLSGRKAAGNGSLMRTAPVGVFFYKDAPARMKASLEDSAITHFDPRCQIACVAFNAAIGRAIGAVGEPKKEDLLEEMGLALSLAGAELGKTADEFVAEITEAAQFVRDDLTMAQKDDPELYGPELHMHQHQGYVRVAFRLAFWELFHAPSFEAGLIDVVNRGGDSDTNGAIAGALLGAFYGEGAIPERWKKPVLEALSNRPGPLYELYHPRNLLTLLEAT